jgi:tRNA 2-selenouridine synthase
MSQQPPALNTPQYTDEFWSFGKPGPFDDVIDVRSPAEFAEDHIPDAVNLPVLNDAERALVGTIYREQGGFPARKIGGAIVSANIATHLREHFASREKDYRPFLYCWRGGQRSASMATVLAQVGWRVTVLRGGYKTYRQHVRRRLEELPLLFDYRVIAGATGTGKTRLLQALAARGAQVIDLEGLANHRGSVLGYMGKQPEQKGFDSRLLQAFERLEVGRPVWIEAESNRVGDIYLPPALWQRMRSASVIEVRIPIQERIRHLVEEYAALRANRDELEQKLRQLSTLRGPRQIEEWCRQVEAEAWGPLTESLLREHYDPAYAASAGKYYSNVTRVVSVPDASQETLERLAGDLHLRETEDRDSRS